ncbi:MAG TPA: penicillin acylase family protein, partial [Spirochaetia bacterium]|nr:penicillin acylase family protein [Spirochaetia bacterium]
LNFDGSAEVNATGQSGHVGSGHYSDMIVPWARVRYHAVYWDEATLRKAGVTRLVLEPARPARSAARGAATAASPASPGSPGPSGSAKSGGGSASGDSGQ